VNEVGAAPASAACRSGAQRRRAWPIKRTRHSAMHSLHPASTATHSNKKRNIEARSEDMA